MKEFPLLEVTGSHRDVGMAIGEMHRNRIRERIEVRRQKIPNYRSYLEKVPDYIAITEKYFPNLVEEARGVAQASSTPFEEYFFAQVRDLYPFYIDDDENLGKIDHCTVIVSFNSHGPIVGQNEDWILKAQDDLYLLKATINGVTFFGLQYAVSIPGESASINSSRLVQCITEIHPTSKFGVPKNFVSRAILEAKSLEEAERIIFETPKASGYNHVLVQGDRVWNFEIAGDDYTVEKFEKKSFVHTNHFTSDKLKKYEMYRTKSSIARYDRADKLNRNVSSLQGVMEILSDGVGEYPICRPNETIGSIIFQPRTGIVSVCYGVPSPDKYVKYQMNGKV
jgi:hypothetical protein